MLDTILMNTSSDLLDLTRIPSPIIFQGDARLAYRDPTVHFHDGVFRLFFSYLERERDGRVFAYLGSSQSRDLVTWTPPSLLTPRDQSLNFSSPGNIIRHQGRWVMCLQTYPTPGNELYGTADARLWTMTSDDLETWSEPELLRVKGPDVPVSEMGRMIDPYLVQDLDDPAKWWCFYKQNGVSMSWSRDLQNWTFFGSTRSGENVCILCEGREYLLFHSPANGVGLKKSHDLIHWEDCGLLNLPQADWPWAGGRLTAGFVLDMRSHPGIESYLLFFHGTPAAATAERETHGEASLALAWSADLKHWRWPGAEARP
jgi:hypothetical protein